MHPAAARPLSRPARGGPRPWAREPRARSERRLSRRLAAGLTPAQAAAAEGVPAAEVEALLADPEFAGLVEAYREIESLPEAEARARLLSQARRLLEEAVLAHLARGAPRPRPGRHAGRRRDRRRPPRRSRGHGGRPSRVAAAADAPAPARRPGRPRRLAHRRAPARGPARRAGRAAPRRRGGAGCRGAFRAGRDPTRPHPGPLPSSTGEGAWNAGDGVRPLSRPARDGRGPGRGRSTAPRPTRNAPAGARGAGAAAGPQPPPAPPHGRPEPPARPSPNDREPRPALTACAAAPRPPAQIMYCPPLAVMVEPVMKPASSETRNTTQRAISSGSPRRPTGIWGTIRSDRIFGSIARTISVPM
jgi:hypothetical protein